LNSYKKDTHFHLFIKSEYQIKNTQMEDIAQVSNIKIKSSKSTAPEKKVSPSYKSPFINVWGDTLVHSDTFGELTSISTDTESKPRVILTFRNFRDIYIPFTDDILLNMYKKKMQAKSEKTDKEIEILTNDDEIISNQLTHVVDHVKNKYKMYIKAKNDGHLESRKNKFNGTEVLPKKKAKTTKTAKNETLDNIIDNVMNDNSDSDSSGSD
jgi:hypothetical protein